MSIDSTKTKTRKNTESFFMVWDHIVKGTVLLHQESGDKIPRDDVVCNLLLPAALTIVL